MNKNILIIFVVVLVLFAGFMGYRHFSKNKEMQVHHEDTYRRMTETAQKSSRGGMANMGKALRKYYRDNNSYPAGLDALYPKYINSKSFIDDVNWDYKQQGDDFLLSKSVTRGNKTLVASINKGLKIRMGEGAMLAMVDKKTIETPAEEVIPRPSKPIIGKNTIGAAADIAIEQQPGPGMLPGFKMPGGKPVVAKKLKEPAEDKVITFESETESEIIASRLSGEFLVWKNKDGTVGFGNVQYPETGDIDYTNTEGAWYKLSKDTVVEKQPEKVTTFKSETESEIIASRLGGEFLMWKNRDGTVGFGNVQYPERSDIEYVNVDGTWYKFPK